MELNMKNKAVVAAILAVSLSTAGAAFAQGGFIAPDRNDRGHNEQEQRGAGPNHSYHKGDRLPAAEHRKQDVVSDWRGHHLSAPPRGYHWVQSGSDFVLVAIATGIISQLLLND
jgi:Ni/Co efflux regulator RcnB